MNQPSPTSARRPLPWLIVGAIVLLIAVVMYARTRPSPPAQAEPVAQVPSGVAPIAPRAQPAPVRLDPAEVRQQVRERNRATAEKRQAVQAEVDRTQAAFTSKYQNEPTDAAWAAAKESALNRLSTNNQINDMGVQPKNLAIDCKTTMCHITADFPNMGMGDDWVTLYMNNVAAEVPVASYKYIQKPDGTVTINVYAMGRK